MAAVYGVGRRLSSFCLGSVIGGTGLVLGRIMAYRALSTQDASRGGGMRISRIIGIDGWSVYARATDGRVVYTIVECISDWLFAPHKGEGEYGTEQWKEDWEFIFATVRDTAHTFVWHPVEVGNSLEISDEDFARQSARLHFREGKPLNADVP